MKRFIALLVLLVVPLVVMAQSVPGPAINPNCNTQTGQGCTIWTPSQWISAWQAKMDATAGAIAEALGYTPLNKAGDTMTGKLTYQAPIAYNMNQTLSGSSVPPLFQMAVGNISGSYSNPGSINAGLAVITNTVDTASLSGTNDNYPGLYVQRQFGGTGASGARVGASVNLVQTLPVTSGNSQYVATDTFFTAQANAGGTGNTLSTAGGNGYAFYPQVWLQPGATDYNIASLWEGDVIVEPSRQKLTVGGTIVNGDVITLTFTSANISGSPVSVTYTAGTGNTATHIVNGLMAAVSQTASLQAAGVAAPQDGATSSVLDIVWPTTSTVAVSVGTTGAETLSLNTAVSGASTAQRIGATIARGGNDGIQAGTPSLDIAFHISDQTHAATSGQWLMGLGFGGEGVWPIAYNGTIIGSGLQTILNGSGAQGPFSNPQALYGIDWHQVNFSLAGGASINMPGLTVDGTGAVTLKAAKFTASSTGLTLAVGGFIGSGNPAVVSGGGGGAGVTTGNYFVGDIIFDAYGGQYQVSTVNNSTGAVTALTALVQPGTTGSTWGTGLATTGGSGSGLTISPTANAVSALSLNTGGNTAIGSLSGTHFTVNSSGDITGNTITSSGSAGLGQITAGAGSTDHVSLTPVASGTTAGPAVTGTGSDGVTFNAQNNGTIFIGTAASPLKLAGTGMWAANGAVATAMSSLGPAGSHATIQEWFQVTDSSGTVRYIPAF